MASAVVVVVLAWMTLSAFLALGAGHVLRRADVLGRSRRRAATPEQQHGRAQDGLAAAAR